MVEPFSVALAPAVFTDSVVPVIAEAAACVMVLPAPPVVVNDTLPAPAFSVLFTASTPLVLSVTPPVAPTAPVTVKPPASSTFSAPVPSAVAPRFVIALVAVPSAAFALVVVNVKVLPVITPAAV